MAAGFDPGLTQQFTGKLRRVINKDGSFNVRRMGGSWRHFSTYLFLVDTGWPRFIAVLFLGCLAINLLFTGLYLATGIDHLAGAGVNTGAGPLLSAFFFSIHTLTTVGYGNVYPVGVLANSIAALEAMTGLLGFALATGLLFARFSRPSARIVFSRSLLVAPYQNGSSLQFRIANGRSNNLLELEARLLLMTVDWAEGQLRRNYAELALERTSVHFFPLTWTVVHVINESSPLYRKRPEDLSRLDAEFLILIKAFDDTFSQMVNARYSYRHDELLWGARFQPAFHIDSKGDMVLNLSALDAITEAKLL